MIDLFHRRIHDETAPEEEDQRLEIERSADDRIGERHDTPGSGGGVRCLFDIGVFEDEKRLDNAGEDFHDHEEQHETQENGNRDPGLTHHRLFVCRCPLGLDRNVEQIVEPEHRLQKNQ